MNADIKFSKDLSDRLSEAPLYRKIDTGHFFYSAYSFVGFALDLPCPVDKSTRTFHLDIFPKSVKDAMAKEPGDRPSAGHVTEDGKLLFTIQLRGTCMTCKSSHVDLLLQGFTEEPVDLQYGLDVPRANVFLRKIGQYPPNEISPPPVIARYLTTEDLDLYKKALMNLSSSYGIGAFAYMRRIVENELRRMINDLAESQLATASRIKELLASHDNARMADLVDAVLPHLPPSLRELGDNPFKLLYGLLSEGLHGRSDEDCLAKAQSLDTVLRFTIKKIQEEGSEINSVREALKNLRN